METQIYSFFESAPTILLILSIAFLLYTLGKGADILVEEAVSLSIKWNIPKAIIGATIISLGTTLPEAAVSVMAAISGNPDLALGNAIGSIIADTGLIIGISAIFGNLPVSHKISSFQGRIQYLMTFILVIICMIPKFTGQNANISRTTGFIFLILLIAYIFMSLKNSKQPRHIEKEINDELVDEYSLKPTSVYVQFAKLALGIFIVIISSKLLIPSVQVAAIRVGIPQGIIAATLIAFGTSLPELVTAITAVRKGHGDLAVGNIVGADILNILFVIGASASVTAQGLSIPDTFYKLQIPLMLLIVSVFRFFSKKPTDRIPKYAGAILLSLYIIYIVLNFL